MLNLTVAMYRTILLIFLFFTLPWRLPPQQSAPGVVIDSPKPGEALQGKVAIQGSVPAEGFESYEVSFSYQRDTTNTWFLIEQGKDAVSGGTLANWDTTTIADGTYRIRVSAVLKGGKGVQTMVTGLRVRNYTTVETSTPAPVTAEGTPNPATPAPADYKPALKTGTPVGANPAEVSSQDLSSSLMMGGMVAMGLFVLLGLYLGVRGLFRRG